VLELACGTGLVTFRAAAAVQPAGHVVATDISDKMVEHLRQAASAAGFRNIDVARSEAEVLRYPDSSFDAVLCALGLMYVTDPLASLREVARVLKPGGRIVAAVWGARANCGWAEIFPIVDSRVRSEVCPMFFQLGTGNALAMTLEMAGLVNLKVERISTTLHYSSEEEACGAAFAGGPVALAYSRFDDRTKEEAFAEYLESIRSFRRGNGYAIPGEFVVARAERAYPSRVS
jgi:ubiquinone/menaquinone biosynthesis C-methylase UbiE